MSDPIRDVRIKFLDGLRGVAVLMVIFYHLYHLQILNDAPQGNEFLASFSRFGKKGVYIFFVVSGFIIAYVTSGKITSWSYLWRFTLRRHLRLDPPFWASLILAISIAFISIKILHKDTYLPSVYDLLANVTYSFRILEYYDIIRVGWTLCLEVQFYLVFIFLMFMLYMTGLSRPYTTLIHYGLFLISIGFAVLLGFNRNGFIGQYWLIFFLGIAAAYGINKNFSTSFYLLTILTIVLGMFVFPQLDKVIILVSVLTSVSIFLALKFGKENKWLAGHFFQFFGRISYSLYLTHCIIGNRIIRFLKSYTHWEINNAWLTFLILFIAFASSVLISYTFYIFIEKPSVLYAKNVTDKNYKLEKL